MALAKRVRRLCTELRPPILDDLGLTAAIEWQAREFQNRTSIECVLHPDNVTMDLELEPATALFRIFQEILTNVARHAKATRVDVELMANNGHLILEVKDNGRGIPENKLAGEVSLGILGMRERAMLLERQSWASGGCGGQRHDGDRVDTHQEQSPRIIMTGTKHSSLETAPERAPVTTRPLRILIADDHAVVRDGLKQLLADRYANTIFRRGSEHTAGFG